MNALTIDLSDARQRPLNYLEMCQTIAESYPFEIAHGIQKDAIQNGMDALIGKGPLKFIFELIETSEGLFFTMTDNGTCGLTGPVLKFEDYEKELGPDYHWARFESFAFTKPDPDAIGARGQGKFVFLAGSKKGTMFYDSLRKDGTYRMGFTVATRTGCPMSHRDEDEGRNFLNKLTALAPLVKAGTRIVENQELVDPSDVYEYHIWHAVREYCPVTLLPKGEKERSDEGRISKRKGKKYDHFELCYKLGKYEWGDVQWIPTWTEWVDLIEAPGLIRDIRIVPEIGKLARSLEPSVLKEKFREIVKELRKEFPTKERVIESTGFVDSVIKEKIKATFRRVTGNN